MTFISLNSKWWDWLDFYISILKLTSPLMFKCHVVEIRKSLMKSYHKNHKQLLQQYNAGQITSPITRSAPFNFALSKTYNSIIRGSVEFIINHRLESVDALDAILPIIISSHIFTELSTFYASEGNSGASDYGFYPFYVFVRVYRVIIGFPIWLYVKSIANLLEDCLCQRLHCLLALLCI